MMATKIVNKTAGEKFDIGIDWTAALAEISDSETIASSDWELLYGTLTLNTTEVPVSGLPGHSVDENEAIAWCEAGTAGTTAVVRNTITTLGGRELSEDIIINLKNAIVEPVHTSRIFLLERIGDGLTVREKDRKTISVGPPNTYAADFRNDAAASQSIATIDSIEIVSGTAGGITFGIEADWVPGGKRAIFRMTGVTAGDYTVRVEVTYSDGNAERGDILVKVVS